MIGSDNLNMQNVIKSANERKPEKKNDRDEEKHQSALVGFFKNHHRKKADNDEYNLREGCKLKTVQPCSLYHFIFNFLFGKGYKINAGQ